MTRSSPWAIIMASSIVVILILNSGIQSTTAFVLPSLTSAFTPRTMERCFHASSSFVDGSHIRRISLRSTVEQNVEMKDMLAKTPMPKQDKNGIYDLSSKEDHLALLADHPGKIIIMKFYAPWCRTCKGLEPKFIQLSKDPKYTPLPLLFAQMSVQYDKEYVKSLGIASLPSVHINAGSECLVDNFPCSPRKIPILKKKIAQIVNSKVDPETLRLKAV